MYANHGERRAMSKRPEELGFGVFSPPDLNAMRDAFLCVRAGKSFETAEDIEILGRMIIRLYRMGLVEPCKLASVAAMMASSRLFRVAHS